MDNETTLGIDIGGTSTKLALVNRRGEVLARGRVATTGARFADLCRVAAEETRRLCASTGIPMPLAVGVGAPAASRDKGIITQATNLPWDSPIPAVADLQAAFSLPVALDNDANAAAIGEMTYGVARGLSDFIMVTLGTGVGGAIVADGKLIYGRNGWAGELGHVIVNDVDGPKCSCGRYGCLESYASAPSIVRLSGHPEMSAHDVAVAAGEGDEACRRAFATAGHYLGLALANYAAVTSPQAIVLFGGVTRAGKLLMEPVEESFESHALFFFNHGQVPILVSSLPEDDAALLGSSALAWHALT